MRISSSSYFITQTFTETTIWYEGSKETRKDSLIWVTLGFWRLACEVESLIFLVLSFLEAQCIWKANSAKLAMQVSEKKGESGILGASL